MAKCTENYGQFKQIMFEEDKKLQQIYFKLHISW